MELVQRGLTSKQIARQLGISHRTVDQHIAAVIDILQVNNRTAAVTRLREIADERDRTSNPFLLNESNKLADFSAAFISPFGDLPASVPPTKARIFPALGGEVNVASVRQRIIWICRIGLCAVILSCFVILTILGLSDLARFSGL